MKNCSRALLGLWLCVGAGLVSGCGSDEKKGALEPLSPPRIISFRATPSIVTAGQSATLTFMTSHADAVTILDESGAELPLTGGPAIGSAVVTPSRTAFYVLRAEGQGGRDVSYAQVAVDGPLQDTLLVAVPTEISSGDEVQLLWAAPGSQDVSVTDASSGQLLSFESVKRSGILTLTPARTTTYRLSATGAAEPMTREAKVFVSPVLVDFTVTPQAAKVGEKVVFSWRTRGASQVIVEEALFGELTSVTAPGQADSGAFVWTVPATAPSGAQLVEGTPLTFGLRVRSEEPAVTQRATVEGFVGDGARIDLFDGPEAVTVGKSLTLRWKTRNATGLRLLANGLPIYSPLASETALVREGSRALPAPAVDTTYTLEVTSEAGERARASRKVRPVKAPSVASFTLPGNVGAAGGTATAQWQTADATRIQLRIENGPTVFSTRAPAQLTTGSHGLYPARPTTYVLEAYNEAGDVAVAQRKIHVGTAAGVSVTPPSGGPGAQVSLSYDLHGLSVADIVGIPSPLPQEDDTLPWLELKHHAEAKPLYFDDVNEGVAGFSSPGFRFPFIDGLREAFFVSTNGYLAFESPPSVRVNTHLPNAALPSLLAPFWDDLTLGAEGQVLWLVEGSGYPRRLIVEWSDVSSVANPDLTLSFQVQLFETGEFRFTYRAPAGKSLTGAGASATVGAQRTGGAFPQAFTFVAGALPVVSGRTLSYFTGNPLTGSWTQALERHARFSLFVRLAGGGYLVDSLPVWIFGPGSVAVTEAMPQPDVTAATLGGWIELRNNDSVEVDLGGLMLLSNTANGSFELPSPTRLRPGGFLVLGQSLNLDDTGGAPVEVSYADSLPLGVADILTLSVGGTVLSTLEWGNSDPARSVLAPERAIDSTGAAVSCPRKASFGNNGALGTPGAENETCFNFRPALTSPAYRDISATGMSLFAASALDSGMATVDISSHPLPLFGTVASQLRVSTNGFVTTGTEGTSSYAFSATKPSSTTPSKTFALFGDDLTGNDAFADRNVYALWVDAGVDPAAPLGHWIIQWHHFTPYYSSPKDDVSFQLKLFSDGSVEYHYGELKRNDTGTGESEANGASATVWIENAAEQALVISLQEPKLVSHSAYRFSPVAPVGLP